jgi:hypothetical protein
MSILVLVGVVLVASAWHPLGATSRSAATSAGLRLTAAFVFLVALVFFPQGFDHGTAGQDTQTCPSYINSHSAAWWVSLVMLGAVWWWVVGVLKATGLSFHRGEQHAGAALAATIAALALGVVALFAIALTGICP